MGRLIDADGLKKEIVDFKASLQPRNQDYGTGYFSALSVVEGMLAYAPTVDAVQVVRCRECKYGKTWKSAFGFKGFKCDLLCVDVSPEAFCSYGERKDGDGDGEN